jgi:hypothetical protein
MQDKVLVRQGAAAALFALLPKMRSKPVGARSFHAVCAKPPRRHPMLSSKH